MTKNLLLGPILAHLAQIRAAKFLKKNLAFSITRYYGQLSSCTISEKTHDPILRTDGQVDGRTDERDFIGRCPTNVERPKSVKNTHGGVLILVNFHAKTCNFIKCNTHSWVFFMFFKLYRWHQIS